LLGDTIVYVQQWDEFNDPYVVTGDNYDVHLKVVFGGSFTGTDIPGVYNRTYQAVDHSGNVSDMVARWIVVYPRVGLTENSQENKQLNLYPNPATNFLHLHVGNPGQGMQYVEVKDMCGRKMWQTAPVMTAKTDWNLDVSRLPSGIYFINYLSGNQQYPYKVVVTH
jgi:hypothetical protein